MFNYKIHCTVDLTKARESVKSIIDGMNETISSCGIQGKITLRYPVVYSMEISRKLTAKEIQEMKTVFLETGKNLDLQVSSIRLLRSKSSSKSQS